jgi:hypothetical protein
MKLVPVILTFILVLLCGATIILDHEDIVRLVAIFVGAFSMLGLFVSLDILADELNK